MEFDSLQLVKGLGGEVTFATRGAHYDWHVLDDEEIAPLSITPGNVPNPRSELSTDIAAKGLGTFMFRHIL